MAKTYNVLTIDIKEDISDIITAKQDDTMSRYLDVRLQDDGQPINLTGNEVKIYGRKADGKAFFNNGQITNATSGRCQFELTNQALAVAGIVKLEISIWQNNERILTTPTFGVHVLPKIRNDDAIESSNEFGALVVLYQKLYDFWMDVENVLGTTTDTGGSATEGSVMAKLNAILTSGASSGLKVKSVQSGKVKDFFSKDNPGDIITVRINTIVVSKSILYVLPYPDNKGGLYQMAGWDEVKLKDTEIERSVAKNRSSYDGSVSYSSTGFDYWIVEFE